LAGVLPDANISNVCHIVARRKGGQRWSQDYPPEKLNSYENLLLLCPSHHTQVDLRTCRLTADDLRKMKTTHEVWVSSRLSVGRAWLCNVEQLYYVNVPRLAMLAALKGIDMDTDAAYGTGCLYDLGLELARMLVAFEGVVRELTPTVVAIDASSTPDEALVGTTCSFIGSFRTRGFPTLDDIRSGRFRMRGDQAKDPCVYLRLRSLRLELSIDPRWVTTSTSFSTFREGWGRFAGLATVKQVDAGIKTAYASPLFIGTPKLQQ